MKAPKKPNRLRSTALLVRLTDKELASIKKAAARAAQPVAWWVRGAIEEKLGKG